MSSTILRLESPQNKLTPRQKLFVSHYIQCLNASKSAREAGYNGTSGVIGPRLLGNVRVKQEIERQLALVHKSPEEIVYRIERMASARIGDHIDDDGNIAIDRDNDDVIKSYSTSDKGEKIELYSALEANKILLQYHHLLETSPLQQSFTQNNIQINNWQDYAKALGVGEDEAMREVQAILAERNSDETVIP